MTKEEAIQRLTDIHKFSGLLGLETADKQALSMGIDALEQEPILDKIRAEIEKVVWEDVVISLDGTDEVRIPRLDPNDVFKIIDKYRK